jgi:hypothetical protein
MVLSQAIFPQALRVDLLEPETLGMGINCLNISDQYQFNMVCCKDYFERNKAGFKINYDCPHNALPACLL